VGEWIYTRFQIADTSRSQTSKKRHKKNQTVWRPDLSSTIIAISFASVIVSFSVFLTSIKIDVASYFFPNLYENRKVRLEEVQVLSDLLVGVDAMESLRRECFGSLKPIKETISYPSEIRLSMQQTDAIRSKCDGLDSQLIVFGSKVDAYLHRRYSEIPKLKVGESSRDYWGDR
jgi:hypothetical protein